MTKSQFQNYVNYCRQFAREERWADRDSDGEFVGKDFRLKGCQYHTIVSGPLELSCRRKTTSDWVWFTLTWVDSEVKVLHSREPNWQSDVSGVTAIDTFEKLCGRSFSEEMGPELLLDSHYPNQEDNG